MELFNVLVCAAVKTHIPARLCPHRLHLSDALTIADVEHGL